MTTAFVLSGGGSLGAVQVGMLLALADAGIRPDVVVGSSVGALNAAFVAGRPDRAALDDLAALWTGMRRQDVFPVSVMHVLRALRGHGTAVSDARGLRGLVERELGYSRIEDAHCPLSVVATEVTTGHEVVLSAGPVVDAALASAALPGVFPPVEVEGHLLMDGGVVDNTPISVAHDLGADRVYVLPTGYACALDGPPRNPIGMAIHAVTLAIQHRLIRDVRTLASVVELHVAPPLCPLAVSPIDFRRARQLIDRARAQTRTWLGEPEPADPAGHLGVHTHRTPRSEHRPAR